MIPVNIMLITNNYVKAIFIAFIVFSMCFSQVHYNHPELVWQTFETKNFKIHFYDDTESSAREGAEVAENIFPYITDLYNYKPTEKTHIIFTDVDDISNGAAYYYDNKIIIWTSPLDFDLRGSHRWLQNVITHEFTHIVSIQKAMKYGQNIPGGYLQFMGYEDIKRKDVLYGYPNILISYPIPGTVVPPWLAEGTAQYMYDSADWDNWDTHRDMILRDRILYDNLLTINEMNTFGKTGIGNESIYNAGYALCKYIAENYGSESLRMIMDELSKPFSYSVHSAIERTIGISSLELFTEFKNDLENKYSTSLGLIKNNEQSGTVIISKGTSNLYPVWAPDGNKFGFLSNKGNDYFGQTGLYVYDLETQKDSLISAGVKSKAAWSEDGTKIYYSKKPKYPNKYGSKYFDLFQYSFKTEEESRLTYESRAFSPVVISDSLLAYIGTSGGYQNIFLFDMLNKTTTQLTRFGDHRILHSLYYDKNQNRVYFDFTSHHFRDIGYYNFDTNKVEILISNGWDERSLITQGNNYIFSDDESGIFNLLLIDESGQKQYITNVAGGAFMPDINESGQILFSVYENGKYSISLIESINACETILLRKRDYDFIPPILTKNHEKKESYIDQFPPMFILPKIMSDYNTVKPGFYFYSSEILERLSLFGGFSANTVKDMDLFFLMEFKRFYPTLFTEVLYITRNKFENTTDVYDYQDDLRFRMVQFKFGAKMPVRGIHSIESYVIWQRYRAFFKRSIPFENLEGGAAYDYFRGNSIGLNWKTKLMKKRSGFGFLPSKGFEVDVHLSYEHNNFITGLNLSDSGTLLEEFSPNHTGKMEFSGTYNFEIPKAKGLMFSTNTSFGFLTNTRVDSFFHFFAGGLPGIKGYPFYSIEGSRFAIEQLSLRFPIFYNYNIPIGMFTFQNSSLGFVYSVGDGWRKNSEIEWKQSAGVELRINGFSFYNYPTAISLEVHRGINSFVNEFGSETLKFGGENQFYFSILFGFNN